MHLSCRIKPTFAASIIKKVYNDEKTIVYLNCDILFKQYCDITQKENNPFTEIALTQAKKKRSD